MIVRLRAKAAGVKEVDVCLIMTSLVYLREPCTGRKLFSVKNNTPPSFLLGVPLSLR